MDVRSELQFSPQQDSAQDVSPEEEQRFTEWMQKRLSLYQMMEQQVQASIKQTVHLGSEFTKQLEEETEHLMARYRRQHQDQLQLRAALRQEVNELRTALADERRTHETGLAQTRRQAETEIAQAWRQSETEIAQQRAAARAERERMLREAYAERDRVLAETRQLSARLAELQRALSDLLRPLSAVTPSFVAAPAVPPEPSPLIGEVIEERTDTGKPHDSLTLPLETVLVAPPQPAEVDYVYEYQVLFKGVQNFVIASDLIDQLSQLPGIKGTRLVEYEQYELTIAVTYSGLLPLSMLLKDQMAAVAQIVDQHGAQVHLVYHAVA